MKKPLHTIFSWSDKIALVKNYSPGALGRLVLSVLILTGIAVNSGAQAPTLSYSGPKTYTAGTAITPLSPTSSGVSASGYGSASTISSGFGSVVLLTADPAGDVFVADPNLPYYPNYYTISKIPAGGGAATRLITPGKGVSGIAVDPTGTFVYFTDQTGAVNRFNYGTGQIVQVVTGVSNISAVTVDKFGNIYFVQYYNGQAAIWKLAAGSSTPFVLYIDPTYSSHLHCDNAGNLYYSVGSNGINMIPTGGNTPVKALSVVVTDFALDGANNIIYVTPSSTIIYKVNAGTTTPVQIGAGATLPMAVDFTGRVSYMQSYAKTGVARISPSGGYTLSTYLPEGLNFDNSTGIISGTPTTGSAATNYTINAINSSGSTTATLNIKIISNDATLSSLGVSKGVLSPVFTGATLTYADTVAYTQSSVTLTPTVNYSTATVKVNGITVNSGATSAAITLASGTNNIPVLVTAEDGVTTKTYTVNVRRTPPSTNSNLSSLGVSSGSLSPAFSGGNKNYTLSTQATSISFSPVVADANATVTVNGVTVTAGSSSPAVPLTRGSNTIKTIVTAQDGTTTSTYSVTVIRQLSSDATLSSIAFGAPTANFSPVFSPTVNSYTVNVGNTTISTTVKPTASNPFASIKVNGVPVTSGASSNGVLLAYGGTNCNIDVTAEDGTINSYSIIISRDADDSADLSDLSANTAAISPAFNASTTNYTAQVANGINYTYISATSKYPGGSSNINNGPSFYPVFLNVGDNQVQVNSISPDGLSSKIYNITITRQPPPDLSFANPTVSTGDALVATSGFGSTTYNVNVDYTLTSVTLSLPTTNPNASVTGYYQKSFQPISGSSPFTIDLSPANSQPNGTGVVTPLIVLVAADNGAGQSYAYYYFNIYQTPSPNASLSALNPSAGTLSPAFDPAVASYTAAVPYKTTSVTLTPVAQGAGAVITVTSNSGSPQAVASGVATTSIPLAEGDNVITTQVVSQDGVNTQAYTATITRAVGHSNADLDYLSITNNNISPVFDPAVTSYAATMTGYPGATINLGVADTTARVSINGNALPAGANYDNIELVTGNNSVSVVVTAQNGSTKTYAIIIAYAPSPDATLYSLNTSDGGFAQAFDPNVFFYTKTVPYELPSIAFTANSTAGEAIMKLNGNQIFNNDQTAGIPLVLGDNVFELDVTSQDGFTTQAYTVTVTRAKSNDSYVNLIALGGGVNFDTPFTFAYNDFTAHVPNSTTSVTVITEPESPVAVITVNGTAVTPDVASGNIPLVVGDNYIPIVVHAQDGTTMNYSITVTRAKSSDDGLAALAISAGTLSPAFDPAVSTYDVSVGNDVRTITLSPTARDPNAVLSMRANYIITDPVTTPVYINGGDNQFLLTVTAQDGSTAQTFTINVHRTPSDAALSALALSAGTLSPALDPAIFNYDLNVDYAVSSLAFTPAAHDPLSALTVNGGRALAFGASKTVAIPVGNKTIAVVVRSADLSNLVPYFINVHRASPSTNNTMTGLAISPGSLNTAFDPAVITYTANVPSSQAYVTVTPTVADATSTTTVNGVVVPPGASSGAISLAVGANAITTTITAQDGVTTQTYTLTVTRATSTNSLLSSLGVGGAALSPGFDSGTASYKATVPFATSSVMLTPVTMDATAAVKVNGTSVVSGTASGAISLNPGNNTITTTVTASDGITTKTYTVIVTRKAAAGNANLTSLAPGSGALSPGFSATQTTYTIALPNSIALFNVTPRLSDTAARIMVNGTPVASGTASQNITLSPGPNSIDIKVTAQDGVTVKTYQLTVTRAFLTNANLSSLRLTSGALSPAFNHLTTAYTATVANALTSVSVIATAVDANAMVAINGGTAMLSTVSQLVNLKIGADTITTVVTAQDGHTVQIYQLVVTRPGSTNGNLSALHLSSGVLSPSFAGAITTDYTASVANTISSITVTPTTAQTTSTVTVNGTAIASATAAGPIALNVGDNIITTIVTAQDSVTRKTYTVTVHRAASTNDNLAGLRLNNGAVLSPVFAGATTTSYTASVANGISSITVTPVTAQTTSTVTVNGMPVISKSTSGGIDLNIGDNIISTVVLAQDGVTKKTYTVTVTRAAASLNSVYEPVGVEKPIESPQLAGTDVVVHQGISPNGDGKNDFLTIDGITNYPDNKLTIMNRNGNIVFEAQGYDNGAQIFDGHSNKTGTMQLPGTYYYSLEYKVKGVTKHKTGFIILKY